MKLDRNIIFAGRTCEKAEIMRRIENAQHEASVTGIGIYDVDMDEKVGQSFVELLKNDAGRQWKNINITRCGGMSVAKVVATIMALPNVRKFSLEGVTIEQEELEKHLHSLLEHGCEASLEDFTLRRCRISAPIASALCRYHNLISLDLSGCTIDSDEVVYELARGIQENSKLETLSLLECRMVDSQVQTILEAFHHHLSLRDVNIGNNKCEVKGMAALANLLKSNDIPISTLALSSCKPDISMLTSALAENTTIRRLDLTFNGLDDCDITLLSESLCINSTLQQLDLEGNKITDAGLCGFCLQLPEMKGLKKILLADNSVGEEGALALAHALRFNMTLEECDIGGRLRCPLDVLEDLDYYLDLNWGGRRILADEDFSLALWPNVIERAASQAGALGRNHLDIINYMIQGPALLQR